MAVSRSSGSQFADLAEADDQGAAGLAAAAGLTKKAELPRRPGGVGRDQGGASGRCRVGGRARLRR